MIFRSDRFNAPRLLAAFAIAGTLVACSSPGNIPGAVPHVAMRAVRTASVQSALQTDLANYITTHSASEGLTAAALSVVVPGQPALNVTAGNATQPLWEIGSNTKAFTSVAILHLEAAGKLSIDDTLAKWLPQYPAWKNVTIRELLDMTSGIPTYNLQGDYILSRFAKNQNYVFTIPQIVGLVYPKLKFVPGTHWDYSNTGYLLAELIIQKASGQSYAAVVRGIIRGAGLKNTYYAEVHYPASITSRLNPGYFFMANNFGLRGRNTQNSTVSYARAGGGMISTPRDMNRWIVALFGGKLLAPTQQRELLRCIDIDGKPTNSNGFGLGIGCQDRPPWGKAHVYEGGMFGYRFVSVYVERSRVTFAFGLNSAPDGGGAIPLAQTLYTTLRAAGSR